MSVKAAAAKHAGQDHPRATARPKANSFQREGYGGVQRRYESIPASVGYIQQDPYGALPPFMTVKRILEEPLIINGVKDKFEGRSGSETLWKSETGNDRDFLPKFLTCSAGAAAKAGHRPGNDFAENARCRRAGFHAGRFGQGGDLQLLRSLGKAQLVIIYITHDLSTVRYFGKDLYHVRGGLWKRRQRKPCFPTRFTVHSGSVQGHI